MDQVYPANESLLFENEAASYAGFWERAGAAILDALIMWVPNLALQSFVGLLPSIVFNIIINWLYYALQESGAAQATLGKRALGLRVTGMDGERISFGQATARHFAKILSALIFFIGYLMMIWDERKQCLHDRLANTLVVKSFR